ncbi:hypothetical protein [Streptomyces griseosporeus]|uniref:hypothetical protein n=1 Tax=Streptomyces griseosporeus TaxID=1910 RepID=UPI00167EB9AB|nr:hypothetical protein [Streptomyces griseosporeus]GHF53450.1 hypothetical protein GCM10018783_22880 [Streptomyces griseosporeus]
MRPRRPRRRHPRRPGGVTGDPDTAQLAAAVGTPMVSLTAQAAPDGERTPYKVPVVRCGDGRPADVVRAIRHLLAHLPR